MSFNGQYEYKIEIDTVDDAKKIVSIATKLKGKIVLKSDSKFSVNAKSLLGVLLAKKLNWSNLRISMEQDHYTEFKQFIVEFE
jgi:phosphotransferase system HPr-like phosphotransfer protein